MTKTSNTKLPRSVRNNNPLNIRITPAQRSGKGRWKGMCAEQKDSDFCQFLDDMWGWRAAFLLLTRNYYHVNHCTTIRAIISRWAPPKDNNNTENYINKVCCLTGLKPEEHLPLPGSRPGVWLALGLAMSFVESGCENTDYFAMLDGWDLARVEAEKGKFADNG